MSFSKEENSSDPQSPDAKVNGVLNGLRKNYMLVGNTHIKTWHGLLVLGIAVGLAAGVLLIANRDGKVEPSDAASIGGVKSGRIAFVGADDEIYIMNSDGTDVGRLTNSPGTDNDPTWSPDGTKIAFRSRRDGDPAIYVMDADGSNARRISAKPGKDSMPTWSPDGTKIAFMSTRDGQPEIYVMNVDGTNAKRLTFNVGRPQAEVPPDIWKAFGFDILSMDAQPTWSPGSKIVFWSNRDGNQELYIMNPDGSDQKRLTFNPTGPDGDPAWSPDGATISFASVRDGTTLPNIYTMSRDGGNAAKLTNFSDPYEAGDMSWSSDGKKIAFQHDVSGASEAEVWIMNADGSSPVSTGQKCNPNYCSPRWQPVNVVFPPPTLSDETQYLLFQLFTYAPSPDGIVKTQPFNAADVKKNIDDILAAVGNQRGDGVHQQIGFAVGPLSLDHTDEELRTTIRKSFNIALQKNVAVAIHIDDSMFWLRRKDLWSDPKNVEWSDWNATVHPQRYVGWAPIKLAPQMCYGSPTLRQEVGRIAEKVIGDEIAKGVAMLKSNNKEHLFAGVIAGWETHLADPSYTGKNDPAVKNLGIVRKTIGYCSLTNMGYNALNPPADFDAAMEKVVNSWINFWAKKLSAGGVPENRIYSHIAFPPRELFTPSFIEQIKAEAGITSFSYSAMVGHAVPSVGFTKNARAGFSVYPGLTKTSDGTEATFANIWNELKKQGNPHWVLAEGTNVMNGGAGAGLSWEEYLKNSFGHGASIVNIFAWPEPTSPYGKATKSKEAIKVYKKFLRGDLHDIFYLKTKSLFIVSTSPNPGNPNAGYSIFTTHPDGSGKKVLATDAGGSPSWTPDGRVIYISKRSGSQQIWIMDEDGNNKHQVGNLDVNINPLMPQLGKNGLIVFIGNDATTEPDGNAGIYVMKSDGSGLKELVHGMQPSLASSGTWVSYTYQTNNPYHREIWRINTDGTGKQQLTFLGEPDYPDANASNISPDERWVAFFSGKEAASPAPGTPPQSIFDWGYRNVAVIPATGGARKTLTPCQPVTTEAELNAATSASGMCIAADNPAWSPDSHWLIFDAGFFGGSDGSETWLVDINGQNFQSFYPISRGIERVPLKYPN